MMAVRLLTALILIEFLQCTATLDNESRLERLMTTLERLVTHYKKTNRDQNIDGLYGLRVIEGQLSVLLEEFANGHIKITPDSMLKRIQAMKKDAEKHSKDALEFVQMQDQNYYEKLHFVVSRPWTLTKPSRSLNLTLIWGKEAYSSNKMKLTESSSDKCMTELSGELHDKSKKCRIGSFCAELMTNKGLTGYGITHQILWTMLAEQAGCIKNLTTAFKGQGYSSMEQFQQEFCTNNFHEMLRMVYGKLGGIIVPKFQDLFLEQQFICPSIGFHEFLTIEYLDQILAWQRPTGCYGLMPKPQKVKGDSFEDLGYDYMEEPELKKGKDRFIAKFQQERNPSNNADVIIQQGNNLVMKSEQSGAKLKVESQPQKAESKSLLGVNAGNSKYSQTSGVQTRHLLAEMVIKNGCLVHKTAVAAGALMMYLRYFLDGKVKILGTHRNHSILAKPFEKFDRGKDRVLLGDKKQGMDNSNQNSKFVHKNANQNNKGNEKDDYENYQKLNDGDDIHRKMVQIDSNGKGGPKDKNDDKDDDYNDNGYDDYSKDKKDDDKDDDYEEEYKKDDKHVKVDDKNDDADYTYYEPDHKEEGEGNKEDGTKHPPLKLEVDSESSYYQGGNATNHTSFKTIFAVLFVSFIVLLFLMYRFIRTRRIHIKYEIRSLLPI